MIYKNIYLAVINYMEKYAKIDIIVNTYCKLNVYIFCSSVLEQQLKTMCAGCHL